MYNQIVPVMRNHLPFSDKVVDRIGTKIIHWFHVTSDKFDTDV